jgi:cobalt/nickel transport system permease protein
VHISEGVLSLPVTAGGWALGAGGLALGLKKTSVEQLPKTALVSSVLFLCSLVHVPIGPSSIHLTLLGLSGFLLGWPVLPALFIALLLQGLLFQFGGLLSLGANTSIMGAAALSGYAIRLLFHNKHYLISAFFAGFTAIITGSLFTIAALVLSSKELRATAVVIMTANIILAVVEGTLTFFIILFILRIKPDVLKSV